MLTIAVVVTLLFPITWALVSGEVPSDYPWHMKTARTPVVDGLPVVPHFLWHLLVRGASALPGFDTRLAAAAVTLASGAATAAAVLMTLPPTPSTDTHARASRWARAVVGLTVMFAAPVFGLYPVDHQNYLGYVGVATYHNPTIALLRPIALVHFWMLARGVSVDRTSNRDIAWLAALTVLSALAKPNYVICAGPALALYGIGITALRRHSFNWKWFALGLAVPAASVLGSQFALSFAAGSGNGIVMAPLAVMQSLSGHLFTKYLLSTLFPITFLVLFPGASRRTPGLILAWITYAFGAALTYLFAESGQRFGAGNFLWSGQISLFILFAWSAAAMLRTFTASARTLDTRMAIAWATLVLHGMAGALFYAMELSAG